MTHSSATVKARILVIDDKPANLDLLERVLERRGYEVKLADSHHSAFAVLATWQTDLILLDIMMPEVDGYHVCEQLKADPKTAEIPVIFLSALTEMFDKVKAFAVGGVDYITKPFQIAEVVARVENHIKIARLQNSMREHNQRLQQEIHDREQAEQALNKNQRYLDTLISNLPGVVYRRRNDNDWTMEFISEGCLALTGYPASAFLDNTERTFSAAIPEEYHASLWQTIQVALAERRPFQLMYPFLTCHGEQRWLWEKGQGIFNQAGELEALEGFIQDVSNQQQAQQALDQTRQHLMMALETVQDGFAYFDAQDRLFFCNRHFQQLYDKVAEHTQIGTHFEAFLRNGLASDLYQTDPFSAPRWLEHRLHLHRNGGRLEQALNDGRWLQITEQRTEDGGYVSLHIDISEHKESESRLRQLNQKLLFFIHETPLAYIEWDTALHITHWNSAAERIFGYEADEVLGHSLTQFIISLSNEVENVAPTKFRSHYTTTNQTKDERQIICEWYNTPLVGEAGEIVGFAALAQDITQRYQTEQALKNAKEQAELANRAKTAFLANMSHELRTPLNGILGYAQVLLKDHELQNKQRQGLEVIQRSGEHLLTLINDLLDFSRIDSGRLELTLGEVRLDEVLQDIVDLFIMRANQKRLSFHYHASPLLQHELLVKADGRRLRQVLLNLLSNAVKFTEQGSLHFSVTYEAPRFTFSVKDSGCGIENEMLANIFLPFQQGQHRHVEGTGLGLAISHRLVSLMGGFLQVESTVKQGSHFWFSLPLPILNQHAIDLLPAPSVQNISGYRLPDTGAIKILLVDDHAQNRRLLEEFLQPLGFLVQQAENGLQALQKAEVFLPDVIIMDVRMPELDGLHCTQRLRQNPLFQKTVIFIFSASAFEHERQQALAAGCNSFLSKPLEADLLLAQLAQHCKIEWRYQTRAATVSVLPPVLPQLDESSLPAAAIQALFHQARIGNVKALLTELEGLLEMYPNALPLLTKIQELANNFEMAKLKELLQTLLVQAETKTASVGE